MRRRAAEALGTEELDAILLDARLTRLLADGAEVREGQPVAGRRVEGFLRVTFTTRAVFHDLHELLHSGREVFFTERGTAALAILGRHLPDPIQFLDMEAEGGWLFRVDHDAEEVVKKVPFRWGAGSFPAALAEAWDLSRSAADEAYALFGAGDSLDALSRFAKKYSSRSKNRLNWALARTKAAGKMHVRSAVPLSSAAAHATGGAGIDLTELPVVELLQASGVSFELPGRHYRRP